MIDFLKTAVLRVLVRLKLYVRLIPSADKFYKRLTHKSIWVKERALQKIMTIPQLTENQKLYEHYLKQFTPNWPPKIEKAKFIGKGGGISSLNVYRKVVVDGKTYFEKTYFNAHRNVYVVKWFQKNIIPLLDPQIKVPQIQKTYPGELCTVVYFDYLDLHDLNEADKEKEIIQFSLDLYKVSNKHQAALNKLDIPVFIKDFRLHFRYHQYSFLAENELLNYNIDMRALEQSMYNSRHILVHGDLNFSNGFTDKTLIDWDSFGYFPVGFEAAHIYFRIQLRQEKTEDFEQWMMKHYKPILLEEDWKGFKHNFIYFLFVFSMEYFVKGHHMELKEQLLSKLKTATKRN